MAHRRPFEVQILPRAIITPLRERVGAFGSAIEPDCGGEAHCSDWFVGSLSLSVSVTRWIEGHSPLQELSTKASEYTHGFPISDSARRMTKKVQILVTATHRVMKAIIHLHVMLSSYSAGTN